VRSEPPHILGGHLVGLLRRADWTDTIWRKRKPVSDPQAIADRAEIGAPRAEFTEPASEQRLERAASALTAHGFTVEILDDDTAARAINAELRPGRSTILLLRKAVGF
jgi:hypothetical protein